MPIQLCDLDFINYWGEGGGADSSPFIDDLEFYSSTPSNTSGNSSTTVLSSSGIPIPITSSHSTIMGATTTALIPPMDIWRKFEMDEDVLLSMSPPNPLGFDEITLDHDPDSDWYESSEILDPTDTTKLNSGSVLFHDCMWAGYCLGSEHEPRTFSRQSSLSNASTTSSNVSSNCCSSSSSSSSTGNSNSSNANNNNNNSDNNSTISNNANNNKIRTAQLTQQTSTQSSNSSNNNNNNNSNSQNSNNSSSNSVVQTIEVPSVCGSVRRVIVQKTVGRSLLIKSRTKSTSDGINIESNSSNNTPSSNNTTTTTNNNNTNSLLTVKNNNNNTITNNTSVLPHPMPPVSLSRPETPQSLSESEDDSCQLDFSSVFHNIDNIDNLKPPQGDLWDEVLAAVEHEQANGIEIPPISSDNESNNKIIVNKSSDHIIINNSTPLTPTKSICSSPSSSSSSSPSSSPIKEPSTNSLLAAATTVVSDHSYDKRAWIRHEEWRLGVQTPSDSEEEIDVVSLFERSRNSSRSSSTSSNHSSSTTLPTNPSAKDQEEIQEITTSKLLSASRAVSRKLRSKITTRTKTFHSIGKRRLPSDSEDYNKSTTRLSKKPRTHYKPCKSRFATDSESDSKEKRDMHNNMERMRRIDLRNSFEELRALVPTLANKERAPKVVILQDAAGYCTDLKIQSRQLASQVAALRKEQERLRATVSGLRRSLAACR